MIETKQVEFKVNDLIIQSNDLIEAYYDNELTTLEHKFIRYVASKIKKNDSQFPDYTIPVKEFAEVMNVKGNNYHSQVKELSDDITRKRIKIRSSNDKMGWFPWFSSIIYVNSHVDVYFNPIIKDFFFIFYCNQTNTHFFFFFTHISFFPFSFLPPSLARPP
ncbi:replication initiation protein, partial [Streptococcus hyovaginalis]